MFLRGWLTIAAGVLLGAMGVFQAVRLARLQQDLGVRAEVRARSEALRWRLELDRAMLNLNQAAMQRALEDVAADAEGVAWCALYEPGGRRLAATAGAGKVEPADLEAAAQDQTREQPLVCRSEDAGELALARITAGGREMVLAVGLKRERGGADLSATILADLFAVAAAALLLAARGLADLLAERKGVRPPGP